MRAPIWTIPALAVAAFALWAGTPVEGGVCDDPDLDGVSLCSGQPDNCTYDFNCDGATGLDDVGRAFDDSPFPVGPGPSDYLCAGMIPCP